jgi:type IV pilus assembly protein PilE
MNPAFSRRRAVQLGFTLIELMIAVAIIGILLRLAYPAYTKSVMKTRRADAKTALLDLAAREERFLATANQYTNTATSLGYNAGSTITVAAPMNVVTGTTAFYQLEVSVTAPAGATPAAYAASAIPVGVQATLDTQCATFMLDNTGKQSVNGTSSASPADCW